MVCVVRSLGCILYELLVGKPPFYTASLIELVWKIKKDEIFWDSRITGDCLFFLQVVNKPFKFLIVVIMKQVRKLMLS